MDEDLRTLCIELALGTIKRLFAKYEINDVMNARTQILERFSQEDLDHYTTARTALDGLGGIG